MRDWFKKDEPFKCKVKGCGLQCFSAKQLAYHGRHSHTLKARFECKAGRLAHAHFTELARAICRGEYKYVPDKVRL